MTDAGNNQGSSKDSETIVEVETIGNPATAKPNEAAPFDPRPGRERVRAWLAGALVGLLAVVVLGIFFATAVGSLTVADAKELAPLLVTPVLALASAATGFFYGARADD